MVTTDVVGLYPHIPHSEGMEAHRTAVDTGNAKIPSTYLVDLAKLALENNYFGFNERIYRQKLGTVIGTKFATVFDNLLWRTGKNAF